MAATIAVLLVVVPGVRASTLESTTDAAAIASSVSSQPGLVTGASWPEQTEAANPSGVAAAGVGEGFAGLYMPDAGATFGLMTTGSVGVANPPNDSPSAGADNLQETRNVHDLSVLKIDVDVPSGKNCLSFDLAFYSEEYPEYVGSAYNDGFLAELDSNSWVYDPETDSVEAPNNFAFDENHNLLTVNSASFAAEGGTALQYDGSTQLLEAATPVTAGQHSIYLSIFDAGDGIYDSAVFLDNLRARTVDPSQCTAGATILDSDGDGLPDNWEEEGHNGVDLPAMGADPQHKDVFVQLDAMKDLRLSQSAINKVENSFAAAPVPNPDGNDGITLHVDNGPASVMDPISGAVWGSLSRANDFGYIPSLGYFEGNNYNWDAFDSLKANLFPSSRESIFHYAVSVNRHGGSGSSGISRGIGSSDFIVSLGPACNPEGACPGPVNWQAGTFMHELGHNIGLRHGGQDDVKYKPNYLSVMNYSFQFTGVLGSGMDYSRFNGADLPGLEEDHLEEQFGFNTWLSGFKTLILCDFGFGHKAWSVVQISGPIDFNCDGDTGDEDVARDLNGDGGKSFLENFDDWEAIKLKGGAIGGEGLGILLPAETESEEPLASEIAEVSEVLVPPPSLDVVGVDGITQSTAEVQVSVNPHGSPTEIAVEYGRSDEYGKQTAFEDVGDGSDNVAATVKLGGLEGGSYHYRVVARSPSHLVYSVDASFDTGQSTAPPPTGSSFSPLTGPAASTPPASATPKKRKRLKCKKGSSPKRVHGKKRCVKKKHRHRSGKHRRV